MKTLDEAYKIATSSLRRCYSQFGILAGHKKFDDYWARDSFFASLGAISLEDYSTVRSNFNLFLNRQKENGQLPRKIRNHFTPLKYIGIRKIKRNLSPRYNNSIYTSSAIDQNSLFLISFLAYIKKTKDFEYLERNYSKIKLSLDWNFTKYSNNLIKQGIFSDWEDTIVKRNHCLYSNVLHYAAINAFVELSKLVDKDNPDYEQKAESLKKEINNRFWKDSYYISMENTDYLDVPGNLLAIIFNVADEQKAEKILDKIKELPLGISSYPKYPIYRKMPWNIVRGSKDYHNGFSWIWVSCLYAISLNKMGNEKEANLVMEKVSDLILKYNDVYEVYFNNKPVNKTLFKAEVPFAWSAGLFVFAYNKLNNNE